MSGQGEAEGGVGAGISGNVTEREHGGDGDEGEAEADDGLKINSRRFARFVSEQGGGAEGGDVDSGAGGGKPFHFVDGFFWRRPWRHNLWAAGDSVVQEGYSPFCFRQIIQAIVVLLGFPK